MRSIIEAGRKAIQAIGPQQEVVVTPTREKLFNFATRHLPSVLRKQAALDRERGKTPQADVDEARAARFENWHDEGLRSILEKGSR